MPGDFLLFPRSSWQKMNVHWPDLLSVTGERTPWLKVTTGDAWQCVSFNPKGRQKEQQKKRGESKKKRKTLVYKVPYFYPDIFVSLVVCALYYTDS